MEGRAAVEADGGPVAEHLAALLAQPVDGPARCQIEYTSAAIPGPPLAPWNGEIPPPIPPPPAAPWRTVEPVTVAVEEPALKIPMLGPAGAAASTAAETAGARPARRCRRRRLPWCTWSPAAYRPEPRSRRGRRARVPPVPPFPAEIELASETSRVEMWR